MRATRPFASYSALGESLTQLESPANRSNFGRIVSLSDQITRSVFRIMYSKYCLLVQILKVDLSPEALDKLKMLWFTY